MSADEGFLDTLVISRMPRVWSPGAFDCGEPDLTEYICDGTACRDQLNRFSRTYLIHSGIDFVGYFTVLTDSIRLATKERPPGCAYATAPALKLGRMAVDLRFRRQAVGRWILDNVVGLARTVAESAGVRYVTLDVTH